LVGTTLAQVTDAAPVILLAHEPDIFPRVPARVALTLSGHTHGGQVRLFGYSPMVPSRFGNRFAYGHIVEEDRHLIVSGGLGCSFLRQLQRMRAKLLGPLIGITGVSSAPSVVIVDEAASRPASYLGSRIPWLM
jgi:hypothetical protein